LDPTAPQYVCHHHSHLCGALHHHILDGGTQPVDFRAQGTVLDVLDVELRLKLALRSGVAPGHGGTAQPHIGTTITIVNY
jgi:hypothetical protein